MNKIPTVTVKYWNTLPFIHGLRNHAVGNQLDLILEIPSECAALVQDGKVEIGLVPTATLPDIKGYSLFTDYCIGSEGPVESVLLLSDRPIDQIESIFLDYHSRTSVQLIQILCREHWNISPRFVHGSKGFIGQISGTNAGLLIGDRALMKRASFKFVYDLGEAWTAMTDLPFVYAVWLKSSHVSDSFHDIFNEAFEYGISHIKNMIIDSESLPTDFDLYKYLTQSISFSLDDKKKDGLRLFMDLQKKIVSQNLVR